MIYAEEIREWDTAKILEGIDTLKKEMFDLRFKQATGQLEDTARLSTVRKTIARMKTVLTERERS